MPRAFKFAGLNKLLKAIKPWQWLLLLTALAVATGWWYQHPKTSEVDYDPCRISYGQVVGEWQGEGDSNWNRQGMHYQARKFSLRASAPSSFYPNVIEAEPTHIATGGEQACSDEFNERIDTAAEKYRWQGARANDIRLGAPDLGELNDNGSYFDASDEVYGNHNLATPVYSRGGEKAAAFVDDGGSAHVIQEEKQQLWCINGRECNHITSQTEENQPQRGSGYQFVADNCPEDIACSDEWYRKEALDAVVPEEAKVAEAFDLRLEATSTYAPTIGAETLLVFAYPTETEVEMDIGASTTRFNPGDSFVIDVDLQRFGPAVDSLDVLLDTSNQPASSEQAKVTLGDEQLQEFNSQDELSLSLPVSISAAANGGDCHNLGIDLEVNGSGGNVIAARSFRYCINTPVTTYRYSVNTRGSVESSLSQFAVQAAETLADQRGWPRANVRFERIDNGGDFTLWLSAPKEMTGFSSGCSPEYSCRVGSNVIINDQRWQNATPSWNQAGGSLRDYRHMVINHEVGHFLGHGHYDCQTPGGPAPVMQQQSIDLQGCSFNPWPLEFEIEAI